MARGARALPAKGREEALRLLTAYGRGEADLSLSDEEAFKIAEEEGLRQFLEERDANAIILDPRNTEAELHFYALEGPVKRDALTVKKTKDLLIDMIGMILIIYCLSLIFQFLHK